MNKRRIDMRFHRGALALFLVFLAAPTFAQEVARLTESGETVAQTMERVKLHQLQRRVSVIDLETMGNPFLIPVAGSAAGANGTFFKSDVTFVNHDSTARTVNVAYFARGVNNGTAQTYNYVIPAQSAVTEEDFIGQRLGKSGIGALLITAFNSAGQVDDTAAIDGFSRIWTRQPGSTGTVSQEFSSVSVLDSLATSYAYGLRQDENYRTNIGAVNIFDTANSYTVKIHGSRGSNTITINVQPYSMDQVSAGSGTYGNFWIEVDSASSNFNWWTVYGSSVDNVTGDGWVSHAH
jgi:hypothetical protein